MPDKLSTYHAKRNFGITPEPKGMVVALSERLRFVVQKHDARRLHYDFRLEIDGTLKSWAVPKGPSLDPAEKRLAVHVEDHPLDYIDFEGDIPEHQYGAGHVDVWDIGYWEPQEDPAAAYRAGKIKFRLDGEKLHGGWTLVRTRLAGSGGKEQWLLIKEKDETARSIKDYDITEALPDSVLQGAPAFQSSVAKKAQAPVKTNDAHLNTRASRTVSKTPAQGKMPGSVKAPLPETMLPQLATLVDEVPSAGEWLFEVKFDGYRLLTRVDNGEVRLFTRDGKDWTARLPKQVEAIKGLRLKTAWLDGEIVVLDEHGVPSFQLLQNAFDEKSPSRILYFLFDVPYLNGYDLRGAALSDRRARLSKLLTDADNSAIRYSAPMSEPPQQLLTSACGMSMEGIIGKLADSPYVGKRSNTWIKLKCQHRQEFVIAGYTEPQGSRKFLGALLLGVYEDGKLRYTGRVGTGFDHKTLLALHQRLSRLEIDKRPFERMPAGVRRAETHWVKPQLVAEISFAEWTTDGIVRQAVFHGLREDKPAKEIRREQSVPVSNGPATIMAGTPEKAVKRRQANPAPTQQAGKDEVAGIRITHADRVVDPSTGLTKFDVATHYARVAPMLLPYLNNRPVYLLRCPEGIRGEQFFQKHATKLSIPGIRLLDPSLDPEHDPLMAIDDAHALAGASQMGMMELHICSATADKIDRPDNMVFDLDPDPSLPWTTVKEAAQLTKVMLDELGLKSFLKTSGGKGLHIVVPLARRHTWDEVTDFSQAIAKHLARTLPKLFSATMGEKNRVKKVFVDFQRNRRHASTVAPYSVRARPGLPVSVPIAWEELDHIDKATAWTVATLPERLDTLKQDPWQDFLTTRQTLTAAMKKTLGLTKK
ncbi:DNA ligase D [Noviherbaspirillum sp. Root189]|uniref:DNA ligase D n=1 Tax=Noviherbaspirillum sp. Root189 TaxID=1736487 RepID=UPI00070AF234|nr:DNA ligase D [Noviherbaspirillum sp. Root189]KRB94259.1 ATP-dependent DNA ligase [Noviherbaspirillum sp. Root189]